MGSKKSFFITHEVFFFYSHIDRTLPSRHIAHIAHSYTVKKFLTYRLMFCFVILFPIVNKGRSAQKRTEKDSLCWKVIRK